MKWKNKGHEYDSIRSRLLEQFGQHPHFYVFGAGIIGRMVGRLFEEYGCFAGFIDNNATLSLGTNNIITLDKYLNLDKESQYPIVISTNLTAKEQIAQQLDGCGKVGEKDYFYYADFVSNIFPLLSLYLWKRSFVRIAQISLTERCTLKCKKCAHGCFAVTRDSKDMEFEKAVHSIDSFFNVVDYINELMLIGGEPFLYERLVDVIEFISSKYRNRINRLSIITNGTVLPKDYVLESLKKNKVFIHISNYTGTLPRLEKQYNNLTDALKEREIAYTLGPKQLEWMDYGFGYYCRNAGSEELERVFDECHTSCREIRENRYYHCIMARAVSENLKYEVVEDDYLDLDMLHGELGKSIFEEYELGYSDKGYSEMCNYCRGGKEAMKYIVPAAEQVDEKNG